MDFSLQKEVEIYRMNNCSFWKMESEMQKTEIQKNEVQSSSKDEMARQILSVTEILIAEIGIQNLSMRKIATRANLALGTLYLYFKTKDDLLNKLAYDLCDRFTHYVQDGYDETDTLFNRYRKMFENKLAFLRDNPTVATNLSQYQAMLGFNEIIERLIHDDDFIWNKFVRDGQEQGIIAQIPAELLHVLGIGIVVEIAYLQQLTQKEYSKETIEQMLLCSWKVITV